MKSKFILITVDISKLILNFISFFYRFVITLSFFKYWKFKPNHYMIHKSKKALILLNGPSLKYSDELLNKYDFVFASNKFMDSYSKFNRKIDYYFVIDKKFIELDSGAWLNRLIQENPQTFFFINYRFFEKIKLDSKNYAFIFDLGLLTRFSKSLIKNSFFVPSFHNVAGMLIYYAANMGFEKIDIIGFDFNNMSNHFYPENSTSKVIDNDRLLTSLFQYFLAQQEFNIIDKAVSKTNVKINILNMNSKVIAFSKAQEKVEYV